tara:strand:- start:216 stop:1130 length:915 start_codon:yes stop_codon:yes gene_type:complete
MKTENAIEVRDLFKKYKNENKIALNNINLSIPYGSIFGLLGPNGAGKSTFINILAGLVTKNSGRVKICKIDIDENPKTAKGAIGVVPQEINIDPFFTPLQVLDIQAGFYGIREKSKKSEEILKDLNLIDKANAYSRSLSGGMKRRLMVAKALVHQPPVLVLDEPTAGVDVELRKKLWFYIKKLNKKGITIILTTHYLQEAEELCDQIAIINKGKIAACDSKIELLNMINTKTIVLELISNIVKIPKELNPYFISKKNNFLTLRFNKDSLNIGKIIKILNQNNYEINDISTKETDLEDIFLKLLK